MTKNLRKEKRQSTKIRAREVLQAYSEIKKELGELAYVVSKNYLYGRIQEKTGLCYKTIAFIINHSSDYSL